MPNLFCRKYNSMGYKCHEIRRANSTILKVNWAVEVKLWVLLIFEQFLGHNSLNLGPNCMESKPFES